MAAKYIEENGIYAFDCTAAVWSTDQIHNFYQDSAHAYGELYFLCDVDLVIESEDYIYLVEYKNANVPGAANPGAFSPDSGNKLENVAKKFFNSMHWLYLAGKDKPRKYIYVLEYPAGNSTSRLLVRNKLAKKLPFALQNAFNSVGRKIINEVKVVSIAEWNADAELSLYPLQPVTTTST